MTIPPWIYLVLKLAIQVGSPYILNLAKKYIATLPAELHQIIDDFINSIQNNTPKAEAKAAALERLDEHKCSGTGCPPTLK